MSFLIQRIDRKFTTLLNKLADRSANATAIMNAVARWFILVLFFFALWRLWQMPSPLPVAYLIRNLIVSYAATTTIGFFVNRKRPFEQKSDPVHLNPWIKTSSFPSGHSTMAFSIATTTAIMLAWPIELSFLLFLSAGLIAISRVIVGVHYISDVVIGSAIGFFLSFFWL